MTKNKLFIIMVVLLFSCSRSKNNSAPVKNELPAVKNKSKPDPKIKEDFDILRLFLDQEAKNTKNKKIDYKNHSVFFKNKGDSYSVSFSEIVREDLNHDGLIDYILIRNSEGMLGGSANTNSSVLYVLMAPNNKISQQHEILIYAPFSYNILENITYKDKKLKAVVTKNPRNYIPEEEKELESKELVFIYKDKSVYEESYLSDCELAKWKNKQLFKGNSIVKKTIEMHNYTEEIYEEFNTQEFNFSANFSGCDNLDLVLEGVLNYQGKDARIFTEKRRQFLEYLKDNTYLKKELILIQKYLMNHELTGQKIKLEDFYFNIYTNHKKGKLIFRLILNQTKNINQIENWGITKRL